MAGVLQAYRDRLQERTKHHMGCALAPAMLCARLLQTLCVHATSRAWLACTKASLVSCSCGCTTVLDGRHMRMISLDIHVKECLRVYQSAGTRTTWTLTTARWRG